ncbi:MAG: GTP-binding protein [Promethearchaeota archaeon]
MVNIEKFEALLDWYFHVLEQEILSVVIADRDGLLMASKTKEDKFDSETIGGLSALVEPVLKRISEEFKSEGFGSGTFDLEEFRMIIIEAGEYAVLVSIIDLYASLDTVFPYAYLMAEKVSRIMDGRSVSPVIPKLRKRGELKVSLKKGVLQKIEPTGSYIFKVILGGDGGVGKTSLVHTFMEGSFQTDYKATIGTSIMKKECKFQGWDTTVRFIIWDLAGQGQFARVRQSYLSEAKAGLMIFDVTRPETFDHIDRWHKEIIRGAGVKITLILIGNKIDLKDERKVTKEQGESLADKLGVSYFETSAKNKDIVDEAFKMLAFQLVQDQIKVVK